MLLAVWVIGRAVFVVATPTEALVDTPRTVQAGIAPAAFAERLPAPSPKVALGRAAAVANARPAPPPRRPSRDATALAPKIETRVVSASAVITMPTALGLPLPPQEQVEPPGVPTSAVAGRIGPNWHASAWMLYRNGPGAAGLAPNGQLGGSQAGARLWGRVAEISRSVALGASLRTASGLRNGAQRELSPGVSVRIAGRVPVEIVAERRFGIGGNAPDHFALLGATGVDDIRLPTGLLASGYVQAGVAGLRSRDGFVDGAARVERPLFEADGLAIRAGANLWGAAQPGLSRVDAGPSVTLRMSTLGQPMRISAEWRQRVAGNAAPGSGPAITIGADF